MAVSGQVFGNPLAAGLAPRYTSRFCTGQARSLTNEVGCLPARYKLKRVDELVQPRQVVCLGLKYK